jgi:MerR family transcriptional regulator, light-induced transcriptional regulator
MSTQEQGAAESRPRHPIRVVAERTGLSPDVLRAWEMRYGVVRPGRSEGGHRLYSDRDVERLNLLRRVTEPGRAIGQVAELETPELTALARKDEEARAAVRDGGGEAEEAVAARAIAEALAAVEKLDPERLDRALRGSALQLGTIRYLEGVVAPFLREIGRLWHEESLRPAHEHLASVGVRRVLEWIAANQGHEKGRPRVVIGTPAGEHHEMGALLAAIAAESAGWEPIYLGPNLPADEIAQAALWTGARAVALSAVYAPHPAAFEAEIRDIRARLAPRVTLLLGGSAALGANGAAKRPGVLPVSDMPEFVRILVGLDAVRPS